jgi:TolB-like protein
MKKAAFFAGLYLVTVSVLPAEEAVPINTALQNAAAFVSGNLPESSKIAVLNAEADTEALSAYILEELSALIVNSRALVVVDRKDLDLIRREENYQLSGEVSGETALRIGHKLGAQFIISGSVTAIGKQYRLRIRALEVETARIQEAFSANVKEDAVLRGLLGKNKPSTPDAWRNKRFHMGAKAGMSAGSYENGGGLVDTAVYRSQKMTGNPAFDASISASVSVWKWFEAQAEAAVTTDAFTLYSGGTSLMTVSYTSLMVPLVIKAVWRPSVFMVQGYAGAYLNVPLGQMEVKHNNGSWTADYTMPPGFVAGGGGGVKLGPGVLFGDARWTADAGNLTASHNGRRAISRRSKVIFSLGYEIGLMNK